MKRVTYKRTPFTSFKNVSQLSSPNPIGKPKGLWYGCGDGWTKFVVNDMGYGEISDKYSYAYELEINKSKVLVIDSEKKFLAFHNEYGVSSDYGSVLIDWKRVAQKYDGIEICPYFYQFRMSHDWYYSWDVASGCIWGSGGIKEITEIPINTKLAQRVAARHLEKLGGQEKIHKEEIDQLHKDLLTYVSNVKKKRITHENMVPFLESLVEFRAKYLNLGLSIDKSVEKVFDKLNQEETTINNVNDMRTLQKLYKGRAIIDEFAQKIMETPPLNKYQAVSEQEFVDLLLAKGLTESQIQGYIKQQGIPTQESLDKMALNQWYEGVGKTWAGSIERLSRKVKKFLEGLVVFFDYLDESLITPKNIEEITRLEGISVIMTDFGDNPDTMQYLDSFKAALKIFKNNAKKRYPKMLKVMQPLRAYWGTHIPKNLGRAVGGFYNPKDSIVNITPIGLKQGAREIAQIVAHEMGHHIWRNVLKAEQKNFWESAILEDHTGKLDIQELIDTMESKNIENLRSDKWKDIDTTLYIQLGTLMFSMARAPFDKEDLEAYLQVGETYLQVPKTPITEYAGMNAEEAFCEALGMFIAYGTTVMMPLVVKWLGTILNINKRGSNMKNLINRVASRYLQAGKKDFRIHHKSYTSAMQEAYAFAEKNGYQVDEESIFQEVTTGRGKPSVGETRKHSLLLMKGDKIQRKALQVQVYGMESGTYELNVYIL